MLKNEETRSLFADTYECRKEEMTAKVVIKSGDQGQHPQAGKTKTTGRQVVFPALLDAGAILPILLFKEKRPHSVLYGKSQISEMKNGMILMTCGDGLELSGDSSSEPCGGRKGWCKSSTLQHQWQHPATCNGARRGLSRIKTLK